MFRVVLHNQWKWSRWFLVTGALAGFAVPLLSVQVTGTPGVLPGEIQGAIQAWSVLYPALAGALGLLAAMAAWAPDHRGRHVYALVLPVARWRYVLLRFTSGLGLLALPAAAVALGALLATTTATLPPGLHGYPFALSLRFVLAMVVGFAVFFAVSAGTARTAGIILASLAAIALVQVLASAANLDLPIAQTIFSQVLEWPGPFAIFTGRWMLIDV